MQDRAYATDWKSGFSLIEVLVSTVILSIGVIGAASMQLAALKTTQQAEFQMHALQLATEMADKLRATKGWGDNDAANPFLKVDYLGVNDPLTLKINCFGPDENCDAHAMASFEIYEMEKKIKRLLPKGRLKICRDVAPWDSSSHSFRWDCTSSDSTGTIVIKLGWSEQRGSNISGVSPAVDQPRFVLTVQS